VASLVEELLTDLEQETQEYNKLLSLSDTKKEFIIQGKVSELEHMTEQEEEIGSNLKHLESKRTALLRDMAVVLGHDGEQMTVTRMIELLDSQPQEQQALTKARDILVEAASKVQFANQQNYILLQQALEMVEFDLTLFKSLKQAPETANYDKNAYNTGSLLGSGSFDTSQ
jgi:flagellar biosynthesis/type III secretory pathway chaperone